MELVFVTGVRSGFAIKSLYSELIKNFYKTTGKKTCKPTAKRVKDLTDVTEEDIQMVK